VSRFRRAVAAGAGVAVGTFLLLAASSALLANSASASPAPGSNLLANGNFEAGFVNGGTPPDWTVTDLGAEPHPYEASIETDNSAAPEYPPPPGGPGPNGISVETFYKQEAASEWRA
jgi:hypothetical protein